MNRIIPPDSKPLDFGRGGIMGSINRQGRLIALNAYHPEHGVVTMTSASPFPDESRYDGGLVRAFRRGLVAEDGFGLRFEQDIVQTQAHFMQDGAVRLSLTLADDTEGSCTLEVLPSLGIVQTWQFDRPMKVRLGGRVWLQRHAYAQLTEGGVLPNISATTSVFDVRDGIGFENKALRWATTMTGMVCEGVSHGDGYVDVSSEAITTRTIRLVFSFGHDREEAGASCRLLQTHVSAKPLALSATDDWLYARALHYGEVCCVPTSDEHTCILTDHMLLPLSWNRDAYYMARLLLCDASGWDTVRRHLLWMFEGAERLNGLWGRSYLANGRIKDRGFQLDQQLFPLLELAEYVQITQDKALLAHVEGYIAPIFQALEAHRAPHALLYATDETPADDPIAHPYPLSSHVLLWHTLRQLGRIGIDVGDGVSAEGIASSIEEHFIATPSTSQRPIYAYATDGYEKHHFYHDANDMPLAFMPAWGFCSAEHVLWRDTVDFAFSSANKKGYYDTTLGSVHTPAPWALGDIQEWVIARAVGDESREQSILARLRWSSQWDGALSEAYDSMTGAVVSRHWFLWTNAVYACVKQGVFDI